MAFVTDPDDLDRYQILFDPESGTETINIRGLGLNRNLNANPDTELTDGATTTGSTNNFSSAALTAGTAVVQNDILVIASGENGVINFYQVQDAVPSGTTLTIKGWNSSTQAFDVDPPSAETGLTYRIFDPVSAAGPNGGNVADGVAMQALYSFCKEEWRTLTNVNLVDLIKFIFPLESITREQFELGGTTHSDWTFYGDYSRNLIRTGGWEELDVNGLTLNRYSGIITLGSLDSDAQVYYQQHDADTDPLDFVLTSAVNQAINVYDLTVNGASIDIASAAGASTITRSTGSFVTDGYEIGGQVTISGTTADDGTYTISNVTALVITTTATFNNTETVNPCYVAVDKRSFLKLFVRKKARSYAGSEIADIGVTQLDTIVNRFPLAHVVDAAITLQDGQLGGYDAGGAVGTSPVYQNVESHTVDTDGQTSVETNGQFTFTSASSFFNTGGLRAGDTLQLSSGSDVGYYEIVSVDGANDLTCFVEPAGLTGQANVPFTGGETTLNFEVFTGTRDLGSASGTVTYTAGASTLNLNDLSRTFNADGGLGARTVQEGDMVLISATSGDTDAIGVFKVDTGGVGTNDLTLNASDLVNHVASIAGDTVTYVVLRPGMHLQYLRQTQASFTPDVNTIIGVGTNTIQIDDSTSEDWNTDYNFAVGANVTISGSTADDGTYIITGFSTTSTTDDTATVINTDGSAVSFTGETANTISLSGEYGFVRALNNPNGSGNADYSFNWRLFGNGGSLQECFEWIQRELRRATTINDGNTAFRGDVNDLLMSFSTPTATTLNMYIDNLLGTDSNNITSQDINDENRNFAFIAGLTVQWNTNFQSSTDANRKIVVFFTNPDLNNGDTPGNEFGTAGAIIVEDSSSTDMTVSGAEATAGLSKTFEFSFDTNNQGNRSGAADATPGTGITVVAIDTEKAQYNLVTGSIQRENSNIVTLAPALERNYSNT